MSGRASSKLIAEDRKLLQSTWPMRWASHSRQTCGKQAARLLPPRTLLYNPTQTEPTMRVEQLHISNFRGIRNVSMTNLGHMVVIAGQNGSGKSCIFDAIRLLKSVYGGYQANEWQQWMGEFQIPISNRSDDYKSIFNDITREMRITCHFKISEDERKFLADNASDMVTEYVWRLELPDAYQWGGYRMAMFAAQFRDRKPAVEKRAAELLPQFISELSAPFVKGECFIPVGSIPHIENSLVLSLIFSTFRPNDIGVIDYHGAQRHYGREMLQGINLNLDAHEQQRSQTALYNYSAKYTNVKGEMAASYVKEILAEQAGIPREKQSTLSNTLKELFQTFFPDKEFLGPTPTTTGTLTFPVRTKGGHLHDLDELSAGEKEILYGYLRIRNSAPKNSIIILDEPELHLNPRLIRSLPHFYKKHLGEALNNQIWLVTHSDALLREVVGTDEYNVFHMLPCSSIAQREDQLRPLKVTADLDLALVDLVGDLAAYRPSGKVVIFEGGGDSDFDRKVVAKLFPELQGRANLISGSNKVRVRALHETLEAASKKGELPFQFYAVVDRDSGPEMSKISSVNVFEWDVYHIENYFINSDFITDVLASIGLGNVLTDEQIIDELRACALETLPQLVRHQMSEFANAELMGAINLGLDPKKGDVSSELYGAISRSVERTQNAFSNALSLDTLKKKEKQITEGLQSDLSTGKWTQTFRGRDVLKRFAGKHASAIQYEVFRNLILSRMSDKNYRPVGMKNVIDKIIA